MCARRKCGVQWSGGGSWCARVTETFLQLELAKEMNHTNSALTVYVTKAMASMADAPKGRKQLQQVIKDLEVLAASEDALVKKHALIAIERITWKP